MRRIQDDIDAVLGVAQRLGLSARVAGDIRHGDRRAFVTLLDAMLDSNSGRTPVWNGARFTYTEVAPVLTAARYLRRLLMSLSRSDFREVITYGRSA